VGLVKLRIRKIIIIHQLTGNLWLVNVEEFYVAYFPLKRVIVYVSERKQVDAFQSTQIQVFKLE
jgi:hypothetical protein